MDDLTALIGRAAALHGHVCPGIVLGIRMALAGCREVAIDPPDDRKALLVFVEIDRCATDGIQAVTGCTLGKRTLRFLDFGKMAATFVNRDTRAAVRVAAREEARESARRFDPPGADRRTAQRRAYEVMPEGELLLIRRVRAETPETPRTRVACSRCGEVINFGREVETGGLPLCVPCARGSYYRLAGP